MRELSLIDSLCLSGLLLASLVRPLLMGFAAPQNAAVRKACVKWAWLGQAIGALCGAAVLLSSAAAPLALAVGIVGCFVCARMLRRGIRAARLGSG